MRTLSAALLLLTATAAAAFDPGSADAIIGDWMVDSHDAAIQIDGVGEGTDRRYVGHIVWLKDDRYKDEDGPDLAGKPVMDLNNPDPSLRDRPILGLRLLWDLRYEGRQWIGGRVYNADSGHTYDCTVHLADPDHLKLHGYVLHLPFLGGSTTWTRITTLPDHSPPLPSSARSTGQLH